MGGRTTEAAQWIRMHRDGACAADIARLCDVDNIFEVLAALVDAKHRDASLQAEHSANLFRHAREMEDRRTAERVFTPAWRRRLEELTTYVRKHGRMPRQAGGDTVETALGRWLHAQRSKVAKGTLEPQQRAALDAVGVWDSDRRAQREEEKFPAQLRALVAFRARHRRLPSYRNRADQHECALGTWLHILRQAAGDGRLPDNLRRALDQSIPGWDS